MPTRTFAGGQVRVEFPPTLTVTEGGRVARSLDDDAAVAHADVVGELTRNGFEVVTQLGVAGARGLGADAGEPLAVGVDVAAEQASVVLVELDGVWSWQLPSTTSRALPGEAATARFDIPAARGLGAALVLRFAAPAIAGLAIKVLERDVARGLLHLRTPDSTSWTRVDTLSDVDLPADRPPRILLLVHGTFSSTIGAFGRLADPDKPGHAFLEGAVETYDAVLGFDHPTLSVDPLNNAEDLYQRLCAHAPAGTSVDIVCHSRGGLVARSLVESMLPDKQWAGTVNRIVFVGVPNAGTHLADPGRWATFVNLYTNLLMAAASPVLGGTVGTAILGAGLKGVGALVKYLAAYAVDGDEVPGLAAMEPGGAFLTGLNQPGSPKPTQAWFAVISDFHSTTGDALGQSPAEFPAALAHWLAEGAMDDILDRANDLVVDTASMTSVDNQPAGFFRDGVDFGANPTVHHLNYFLQDEVAHALITWLIHGTDERYRAEAAMLDDEAGDEVFAEATRDMVAPPTANGHRDRPLVVTGGGGGPEALPPTPTVPAHVLADMPSKITVAVPLTVRVMLSRKEIALTPDTIAAGAGIDVHDGEVFTVQVIPKRNVTVSGSDNDLIALQPGSGTSVLTFDFLPAAAGPVEITVLLRRPSAQIAATMTLRGEAREPDDVDRRRRMIEAQVAAAAENSVVLDDAYWLEIAQLQGPDGVRFQYDLRQPGATPCLRYLSPPLHDHEQYAAKLFTAIERRWTDNAGNPAAFKAFLQDRGADLFERLFPQDMQATLWELRDKLTTVLLMADEPFFPWELVHLKPPVGRRQPEPRFLAQYGLLRWPFLPLPASPELRARPGKVFSLCPRNVDPRYVIIESEQEAAFLAAKLGARDLRASDGAVRRLLRRGGFDVLHFSGHGAVRTADVADAVLLIDGRKVDGNFTTEFLSATTVAENARLSTADGAGPLVVLNACQGGIGGEQLSSLGGFARAFLEAGAQAFVACLWSVKQEPSRVFVEALYEQLLAGATLVQAVTSARNAACTDEDPASWLAYAVYGRPDATLTLQ